MIVELTEKGSLIISSESKIEVYALERWIKENMDRLGHPDYDEIISGSFFIADQCGSDMVNVILNNKNKGE